LTLRTHDRLSRSSIFNETTTTLRIFFGFVPQRLSFVSICRIERLLRYLHSYFIQPAAFNIMTTMKIAILASLLSSAAAFAPAQKVGSIV
jgi:hypothetical protein